MYAEVEKRSMRNPSTKIPTLVSPMKSSSSGSILDKNIKLSSSLTCLSNEEHEGNNYSFWRKNFSSIRLKKNRVNGLHKSCVDDDLESIESIASNYSTMTTNSVCEHVNFAKNGTTYSGKTHKYIVHCSSGLNEQEEYLTPTQRANRNIKKLKSLLQLAKEKLREKEKEIFKLNKEIVELRTREITQINGSVSPSLQDSVELTNSDFKFAQSKSENDTLSCTKIFSEDAPSKHSPHRNQIPIRSSPSHLCNSVNRITCTTPDCGIFSMVDSGNFDDLQSSASVCLNDSYNLINAPELKNFNESMLPVPCNGIKGEEDTMKIIETYEKKLAEKKTEYEMNLSKVIDIKEQKNIEIIHEFEKKLKDEERKFESRWNELLKATEEEKMLIIDRFEKKLEEQKKYRQNLNNFKALDGNITNMILEHTYSKKVEEEKTLYETSLMDLKQKFETEKFLIEEKFDSAMSAERNKFEENLMNIKQICDSQVADFAKKILELETEYSQLLSNFEKVKMKSKGLEKENESLKNMLKEQEENHRTMYLTIFQKGLEAGKLQLENDELEATDKKFKKISTPELFAQLKITEVELENLKDSEYRATRSENQNLCLLSSKEALSLWLLAARKAMYQRLAETQVKYTKQEKCVSDPEATLQFLKSAVYYFLTDRENHLGHLKAIESILAFSPTEKSNIEKLYLNRY